MSDVSFDLSQLSSTDEAVPLAILHPVTEEALGPVVYVRGVNHPLVRKATRNLIDARTRKESQGKSIGAKESDELNGAILSAMIDRIDWNKMKLDDKDPPTKPGETFCTELRKKFWWFALQVETFSAEEKHFFLSSKAIS